MHGIGRHHVMSADIELLASDATLRDFFAAQAPASVPDWFQHPDQFPELPELTLDEALAPRWTVAEFSGMERELLLAAMHLEPPQRVHLPEKWEAAHAQVKLKNGPRRQEIQRVREANAAARWFAWRWHYALTMLRMRVSA